MGSAISVTGALFSPFHESKKEMSLLALWFLFTLALANEGSPLLRVEVVAMSLLGMFFVAL
jgi:hypothetical protein